MNRYLHSKKYITLPIMIAGLLFLTTCEVFSPGLGETIDKSIPAVGVESHGNGTYVGGSFDLSGYATDDLGISEVIVTHGEDTFTAELHGEQWTLNINSGDYSDGDFEITVQATDTNGKTASTNILLIVDNSPPSVMLTSPINYGNESTDPVFNTQIPLKGEAADTTRVKEVRLYINKTDDSVLLDDNTFPGNNSTNVATGTSSWYYNLDISDIEDPNDYYLNVVAEDYSGNKNSYYYHFGDILDISIDTSSAPNIEEINANDFQGIIINPSSLNASLASTRHSDQSNLLILQIDNDSDEPYISYEIPSYEDLDTSGFLEASELDDPADNNFTLSQEFQFKLDDDDGIDDESVKIAIWDGAVLYAEDDPSKSEDDSISYSAGTPGAALPLAGHDWISPDFDIARNKWTYHADLLAGEYQFRVYVQDIYGESFVSEPAFFSVIAEPPVITFVNPSYEDLNNMDDPSENILSLTQRLTGFVEDNDGVNNASVRIAIWNGDGTVIYAEDDPAKSEDDSIGYPPGTPGAALPLVGYDWVALNPTGNQWTFETNLPSGEYQFRIYAEDIFGIISLSDPAFFSVAASAPPNVTITSPNQGTYVGVNSQMTILANITNIGGGVVQLDLDADGDWLDAETILMSDSGGGIFTSGILDAGTDFTVINGLQVFAIRAGTSGSYGFADLQLTGDTTVPTISLTYPGEGDTINGSINFTGSSNDENQISAVYFNIVEGTEAALAGPPADWTGWSTPDGTDLYNWIFNDDTTLRNPVDHTIHFFSIDGAGNVSTAGVGHFSVDQSSDIPVFSLSNMVEGGTTVDNGFGQDASIIGLVEDDDLIDVSTLEIRIDIYDDGIFTGVDLSSPADGDTLDANESEQWIPVSDVPASDSRIVSWSHNLLNIPQGIHSVEIRVSDNNAPAVSAQTVSTDFIIDYGPPDLSIIAPPNGSTQNATFTVNGTASDANGVFDVEMSINGGAYFSVIDTGGGFSSGDVNLNWTYDFVVDSVDGGDGYTTDGDYSYQIRATDMGGGKTTIDQQLIVDATPPTVTVNSPAENAIVNGNMIAGVQGISNDARSVPSIYYVVVDGTTTPPNPTFPDDYTLLGNLTAWSFDLDTTALNNTATSVDYEIWLKAVDAAGNESADEIRNISIDQSTDRPVIDFTDIDKNESNGANNVLVGATNLSGTIEDDDLVDATAIEINIDGGGWIPVSTPPALNKSVVIWKHDISGLTEGLHYVKVRVRDTESGGIWGDSSTSPEYTTTPDFNWNIEDLSGDVNGIPFILNIGPPTITVTAPASYTYHSSDVTISGNSTDANGVKLVEISYDNGSTWSAIADHTGSPVSPAPWSTTYGVTGSNDGTVTYIIRATDAYDSTGIENGLFTVDATLPTAVINLPSDGETVNGTVTITGTAGDNINLDEVYYNLSLTSAGAPNWPGDYTIFSGTYSWSQIIDTTVLADDAYTLRVRSIDSAANVSSIVSNAFTIDQNSDKPVIGYSSILEAGNFVDNLIPASKQVAGTITDDDGVDASTIQYQLFAENGTTLITDWTAISGAPGSDTTLATWTHTFGAGVTDGKYQMKLRAADINAGSVYNAGEFDWNESGLVKFAVDTANPTTTVTLPASNGGYTNQNFTVSGTASDAGGVKRIEIQFGSDPIQQLYEDLVEPFNANEGWSTSFTVDTATHSDDGVLNYTITITDAYDKVNTIDRYINIDTQDPVINALTLINNDAGTPATVNGSVLIQGQPLDNETLVNAVYVITADAQPAEPGADPTAEGWTLLGSTTSINHRFDSTALTDATAYTTYFVVEDLAGNRTSVTDYSNSFTTGQSGNIPVITIDTADSSLLSSVNSVSGSISDDDGVDVSTIEVSIDGGAWIPVTSTSPSDSTNVVFSHSLAAVAEQIASYSIEFRASDIGEDFADDTQDIAPVAAVPQSVNIFVDDSDPSASITQIDNGKSTSPTLSGLYVNDQFVISGTSADSVQIAQVRAKLAPDASFASVTDTDGDASAATPFDTWTYTRTGLSLAGDTVVLNVEVEDVHGKVTPYSYTLLVDTTAPDITLNTTASNPDTASGAYNGTVAFTGTSSDNNQIDSVYYQFATGAAAPTTADPVTDGWTAATGTYGWTFALDTVNDGTYGNNSAIDSTVSLSVVSVDSAGNVSAEDSITFTVNQGSDQPVLSITQPAPGGLIESNKKVIGSLSDDDGLSSLQIRIDRNNDGDFADTDEGYVNISQPAVVSGSNINFEHDLSALADGSYRIELTAVDDANESAYDTTVSAIISFVIDTVAPALTLDILTVQNRYGGADEVINSDFNGSYINNDSTLDFSASDSSGIASLEVDDGSGWSTATDNGDGTYTYAMAVSGLSEGTNNITYRATDNRGKVTSQILTVIVDTGEPVIGFTNPTGVTTVLASDAPNVNGDVTLRGSVTDSSSISSLSLVGGVASDVALTNTGNTISWITSIASSGSYANTTYAYNTGDDGSGGGTAWNGVADGTESWTNIWRFPVEITAFDLAGNRTITTAYVDIDPDSDNPLVSVVSPSDGASVSGTFLVNGTIQDDDGTDYVTLEFDFDDDGLFDDSGDALPGSDLSISNDLNNNTVADDIIEESTDVQLMAPNGSWSIALNASDFTIAKLAAAGYANSGFIRLRLTPYDTNGLAGASQTVRIYLDTTSPVISGLDVDGSTEIANPTPGTGSLQKGTVTLRARFEDDKDLLTSSMLISLDGGATFDPITSIAGATITDQFTTAPYKYYVEIPIDTTTAIAGGNGILSIQLSITDQTNKQNSSSITYNVDNTLPTIHWNEDGSGTLQDLPFIGTPPNEIYNFKGNDGTGDGDDAFKVLGAAIDTGIISGIDKINVYFVKNDDTFWSPVTASTSLAVGANTADIADDTGTPVTIPFTENSTYIITIDNRIEQGQFDLTGGIGDADGFQESLKTKSGYDEWYSFFDTIKLPDGPLKIYAVAYDEAGNMSYTVANGQIANNPPGIPSITVGSTTVDDSNDRTKNAGSVDFTINLADAEGIDVSTIELYITGRYTINSGMPDVLDGSYTPPAALTFADFDSVTPGTDSSSEVVVETVDTTAFASGYYYRYIAEANDTDGNIVQRIFYVWVNNSDSTAPTVTIDDFDQTSVSGSGHVEEEVNSLNDGADADGLDDADLSGTVTVSGTAYDDTSVSTLTVEYSLDNGASWTDAGTASLVVTGGDAIVGFNYSWTYDWDTSTIAGSAEEDVLIRAYGTDGTNVTAEVSRPQVTVDIVPYITGISGTGLESGLLAYVKRSATGRYPIVVGSTLTINGYNLSGTTPDGIAIGGTNLTASSATGTSSMTVSLGVTNTSGDIIVTTNNVASLNNVNDNTLAQNIESNLYNANLNDDRKAVFWNTSALAGSSTYTDSFMSPNSAGTGFEWMYVKSGKELFHFDGAIERKLTSGTGLKGGAFTYNSSGSLVYLFNHNAQWSFAANSYAYTGSVQYGLVPDISTFTFVDTEDEAYNWNIGTTFPKLGLGSVSFGYTTASNDASYLPTGMRYSYNSLDLNRYENLKIRSIGTNALTRNYVAYFDSGSGESRSIVFYGFQIGNDAASVSGSTMVYSNDANSPALRNDAILGGGYFANIDKYVNKGDEANNDVSLTGNQDSNNNGIATPRGRQEVTAVNSGNDSDQFDLAVYEETAGVRHYGFIAYFDEAAQSLKITANESLYAADPTGSTGTWTSAQTIDTNAGADVAIAVDPDGGIHLAYQDVSTGYLKYAYLTFDDGAASGAYGGDESFTVVEQVYVDALFGAGANNSIAVRDFGTNDYRPVIVTFSSAYTGTKAPLRLSYPLFAPGDVSFGAGADSSTSAFLGNWETIALPAGSNPENVENFLFIDGSNNAHLGYSVGGLEESTFLGF